RGAGAGVRRVRTVLVVANQTVGGAPLIEKIREKAAGGDTRFALVVPRNRPRHGGVIYDEAVRHAAEVRLSLARQFMAQEGIEIEGEVGDEDPYNAAMDGIALYKPDEVIVSTLPRTASGWLRRDLVERIREATGLEVEHVVVDLDKEGLPFDVTLVLANQTVGEAGLLERLKAKASERPHMFIVVVPQPHGQGHAPGEARARLNDTLRAFREEGLVCAGMIGDPDPYTAAMNALDSFRVNDVVVSTLPATRSGWMRAHLVERLADTTGKPVDHVEATEAAAPAEEATTA
ncbi:MAG: hypothetical protein M3155_05765, partial [Actinomycetota bacterium]|nr:hypothetical protein [Actinomycetota bacterium]